MSTPRSIRRTLGTRLPLVLLVAGAALTMFAAVEALRTNRSNDDVERRVVRDYSAFVAWAFASALEETLRSSAREVIGAVNHGSALHTGPTIPTAGDLAHLLPFDSACFCHQPAVGPVPETFLAFEIRSDSLRTALNTHPDPAEGWEIDRPLTVPVPTGLFTGYTRAERDSVLRVIRHVAREVPDPDNGFTWVIAQLERGPRAIAYTLMPTSWGDTMVYAAQYTPRAFQSVLAELVTDRDLLPEPFRDGRRNRDIIELAVARGDEVIFAAGEPWKSPYDAVAQLSPRFGSLQVHAAIKQNQAATLVVGGLPRSRVPYLLCLLLLSASLTVVAVLQLRREDELARTRAGWIASVSHELRTPLAQIRLYLDTVRLGRAPTEERRDWALGQVDRETTRLGHLVEKVLTFSRFGQARAVVRIDDAAAALGQIVDEFRPLADARSVHIDATIDDGPAITCRRDGLRHVLLNLLENAVKYGPQGQTVTVRWTRGDAEMVLSVTDQGPGVPAAERDSVWRPFTRGRAGGEHGGSGIGLSIVREVALDAGGRTAIDDAPGGGATFVVTFPFAGPER